MSASRFREIIASTPVRAGQSVIGRSREGRPIDGWVFGEGRRRIGLIAGCHADEPVGPRLLRHLCGYMSSCDKSEPLLTEFQWWVVPHINPDGEQKNLSWQDGAPEHYDIGEYMTHAIRELPGDDIEFGFPRDANDQAARPENRALYDWWRSDPTPFSFHATLHGMAFAAGPWCLIEPGWVPRAANLMDAFSSATIELGYRLHDVERHGEKGFERIAPGFCTRPDSTRMREHFLKLGDPTTAKKFRPSSMEAVRMLGGDPLTVVSEMPLFLTPGVGETLGPPDPVAVEWKQRLDSWRTLGSADAICEQAKSSTLAAFPSSHGMRLQWELIHAGLELTRA